MQTLIGLAAIGLLVFMNAFFVAAEFAFVGSRRTRIAQLAEAGSNSARAAQRAINQLDSYIAATQLGITLASLALGWIGEPAVSHLFEPVIGAIFPAEAAETIGRSISIALSFALVTMLHIVLGELAPKAIALQRPEATAMLVARPTSWFYWLFRPVIYVMNRIGNAVVRMMGFEPASDHSRVHSAEELEMLVHSSTEAGILQHSEEQLLRRVFDFSDIRVEEIMQPRIAVDAIPVDITLPELLEKIRAQHHTRYPVYEEEIDRVIGLLHTKDLFRAVEIDDTLRVTAEGFDLQTIVRPPQFVPATLGLDRVLELMRRTRTHLVIVADEYGGMAGIVTMEDIVEQIVGDVQDEFDTGMALIQPAGEASSVDGQIGMTELIARFGEPDRPFESLTLGGYIAEALDRIPRTGDSIPFGEYQMLVEAMEGHRVARVRFTRRK
jgi:putative hemolysin